MKRVLILLTAAMMNWSTLSAQTHQSFDEGYVFISNLKAYSQRSLKSRVKSTISSGRVAIADENNSFTFPCVDVTEYFVLGSGTFHKYYHPAQEDVPPEYISSAAFKKAVRKVNIYNQVPTSWELGKAYSFKPAFPNQYATPVTVRALRLSGDNVNLVTEMNDNFEATSSINISGETIVEITFTYGKVYWHKGQQVKLAYNDSGHDGYYFLVVDDKGITYSQDEKGVRQIDTKLSYVFGEYPDFDYFGWISDTEIVIDDVLYVAASPSAKKP